MWEQLRWYSVEIRACKVDDGDINDIAHLECFCGQHLDGGVVSQDRGDAGGEHKQQSHVGDRIQKKGKKHSRHQVVQQALASMNGPLAASPTEMAVWLLKLGQVPKAKVFVAESKVVQLHAYHLSHLAIIRRRRASRAGLDGVGLTGMITSMVSSTLKNQMANTGYDVFALEHVLVKVIQQIIVLLLASVAD